MSAPILTDEEEMQCARIVAGALEQEVSDREAFMLMDVCLEHAFAWGVDAAKMFEDAREDPALRQLLAFPIGVAALAATLAARAGKTRSAPVWT